MADGIPAIGTGGASGATVQPQYMGRTMKCYPVHETEMDTISALNTEATTFFSAGSAFVAFAVGIWTNATFYDKLTPMAEIACRLAAPGLLIMALIFMGLGVHAAIRRGSLWRKIKGEAVTIQAVGATSA